MSANLHNIPTLEADERRQTLRDDLLFLGYSTIDATVNVIKNVIKEAIAKAVREHENLKHGETLTAKTLVDQAIAEAMRKHDELEHGETLTRHIEQTIARYLGWDPNGTTGVQPKSLNVTSVGPPPELSPIPLILYCPLCHTQHIDEGEFVTLPHKVHTCQNCGLSWKPCLLPTVGVKFLPGTFNDQK